MNLKPCPFCGSSNVKLFEYPFGFDGDEPDFVQCQDCSSDGPYGTKAGAVEKWNLRSSTACPGGKFENRPFGGEGDEIAVCSACNQPAGAHITPPEELRASVLDEIEKLIGAVEGRHFAAIGTATSEDDKRRHGTKVAFAMELRAAIRALKLTPSPPLRQEEPK